MSEKECNQDLAIIRSKFFDFEQRFNDNLNLKSENLKTKEKNVALESKLQVEIKINSDLKQRLRSLQMQKEEYEDLCCKLKASLNIKDSDETRLLKAKEMVRIGKQYTGIRWDYDTLPTICKGYVKNCSKMTLDCFEYDKNKEPDLVEQLWQRVQQAAGAQWADLDCLNIDDKENIIYNN